MGAPFIKPFDNQPISTTVRSGSYTIPAGFYGRVFTVSPSLTLNGNSVCPSVSISLTASLAAAGDEVQVFSGEGFFNISLTITSIVANVAYNLRNYDDTNTTFNVIRTVGATASDSFSLDAAVTNRLTLYKTSAGSSNWTISGSARFSQSNSYFWVPTGAVLNGSSYIVEEYAMQI
jgi:hypothetical protein